MPEPSCARTTRSAPGHHKPTPGRPFKQRRPINGVEARSRPRFVSKPCVCPSARNDLDLERIVGWAQKKEPVPRYRPRDRSHYSMSDRFRAPHAWVAHTRGTPPDPKRTTPPFLPSDRGGEFARGGKAGRDHFPPLRRGGSGGCFRIGSGACATVS